MHRAAIRTGPFRAVAAFLVMTLAVMIGIAVSTREAQAAITNTFTGRFSANTNGAVMIRGNTSMQCPASTACTDARNASGSGSGESWNNNGYTMEYTDVDGTSATFNDSESNIDMPAGSTVLFAGLYWSGDVTAGTSGAAARSAADKGQVRFGVPGGPLTTVTNTTLYAPGGTGAYQGFADVTSLVAGGGNGVYRVADIQAGTGVDRYAGWALVIAYRNASLPLKSLRVYDGFGVLNNSAGNMSVDIPISGFRTPATGAFDASIGTVVYEGDLGKTGDTLDVSGQSISDSLNPASNVFNSTASEANLVLNNRSPSWPNLMGVDIDQFNATGKLGNNVSSATLKLSTTGETYYPGVVTFTTDLTGPNLITTTSPTDENGGDLVPGDIVRYTIRIDNDGYEDATNTVLTNAIPTGLTYVADSMTVQGAGVPDNGPPLNFTVGTVPTGGFRTVTFRARVNADVTPGTAIVNVPNLSYQDGSSHTLTNAGDSSSVTVQQGKVDLVADLAVTPVLVNRASAPNAVSYTATVTNKAGGDLEPSPVATVTLPTGVTAGTMPSGCSVSGQTVTCTLSAITGGTSGSATFPASVTGSAADTATASLTVTGSATELTPADNTDTAAVRQNRSPNATADTDTTTHNTAVTIPVRANDTDPDDDRSTLTVTVSTINPPAHGTTTVNATTQAIIYTPDYGWRGVDTFVYQVTDPHGASDTATVTVTTGNAGPVAVDDADSTGTGDPVDVDVLDNDSDPNPGDVLAIDSFSQPAPSTAGATSLVSGGIRFAPAATFKGTATFTYVVEDGNGGTDTATVTVTVTDGPPVAANDTATVGYAGTTTIDVLGNDRDPNGDPFTIDAISTPTRGTAVLNSDGRRIDYTAPTGYSGPATFTYTIKDSNGNTSTATVTVTIGNGVPVAPNLNRSTPFNTALVLDLASLSSDPNGDTLTVTGTGTAAHGTVAIRSDGQVSYNPATGYTGSDSYTYTISDGRGGTATGTVNVTVGNAAPTARADTYTVMSNAPAELDVLANDTDPNGDTLTITIDTPPSHGTAQVVSGKIVYRPANGWHGTDTFHYTISDGHGGTSGASVSVTAVDVAPQARPDAATTGTDDPVSLNVLTNDTEPNGDTMTVTAVTAPAHGTVTFTAAGVVTYTPKTGYAGSDTFTYTVSDPAGNTATAVVTITVDNAAPNAIDDRFTVKPGTATELAVLKNDTDPNTGQVLSVLRVGTATKGTVTLTGGKVTYTPNAGATGTDTFTYTVTDDLGATDDATVTITISNGPDIKPDTATTTGSGPVEIDVLANDTDPDGGALTLVDVSTPAHGTAVLTAGNKVRYTPATGYTGTDTFTYTVRDSAGNTQTATVTVTVGSAPPVAVDDTAAAMAGESTDIDVLANDTGQDLEITAVGTPQNGTAEIVDGKIRYTPADGFTGTDTFGYEISDGAGGTAEGTVTVTVTDGRPIAVDDERRTGYQKPITIKVLANDVAPGGTLSLESIGTPDHGTATDDGVDRVLRTRHLHLHRPGHPRAERRRHREGHRRSRAGRPEQGSRRRTRQSRQHPTADRRPERHQDHGQVAGQAETRHRQTQRQRDRDVPGGQGLRRHRQLHLPGRGRRRQPDHRYHHGHRGRRRSRPATGRRQGPVHRQEGRHALLQTLEERHRSVRRKALHRQDRQAETRHRNPQGRHRDVRRRGRIHRDRHDVLHDSGRARRHRPGHHHHPGVVLRERRPAHHRLQPGTGPHRRHAGHVRRWRTAGADRGR